MSKCIKRIKLQINIQTKKKIRTEQKNNSNLTKIKSSHLLFKSKKLIIENNLYVEEMCQYFIMNSYKYLNDLICNLGRGQNDKVVQLPI